MILINLLYEILKDRILDLYIFFQIFQHHNSSRSHLLDEEKAELAYAQLPPAIYPVSPHLLQCYVLVLAEVTCDRYLPLAERLKGSGASENRVWKRETVPAPF